MADMDIAEFLEARLAEREAAARAAAVDPVGAMEAHFEAAALHHEQDWRLYPERETDYDHGQADALHWAARRTREQMLPLSLHDPAAVLADIEAKRKILLAYRTAHVEEVAGRPMARARPGLEYAVAALATAFCDHPDYPLNSREASP